MMKHKELTEKEPKKRSRAGLAVLVIFLILAGAVGYLYYSVCKAPFVPDDPVKLAEAGVMAPEDRFRFSEADGTVQIRMDKADIWSLILTHTDADFLDDINKELESYALEISGFAIRMDEKKGMWLDLELFYKDTRLLAKLPCDLQISGQSISLRPTGLKLGVIPLPVGGLLSAVELTFDQVLPVLTDVTRISYETDTVLLAGPFEQDIRTLVPWDRKLENAVLFCQELQPVVDALETQGGFGTVLAYLEQHPGSVEELYRDLFALTKYETGKAYLADRQGMTQRFFPHIDFDAVAAQRYELEEELGARYVLLERFFSEAVSEYNGARLILSGGEFLQKDQPFLTTQFGYQLYADLAQALDPESFSLVLVDVQNGYTRKTAALGQMTDGEQAFTRSVDLEKSYVLGMLMDSVDGEPYLMYETEYSENGLYHRSITQVKLTEEEADALQIPGKIGVWTD